MPARTIYLITSRPNPTHRSHFAIFIPSPHRQTGTLIHATGAPKAGYTLEFKRNHCPATDTQDKYTVFPIGEIDSSNIVDSPAGDSAKRSDCVPCGAVEDVATRVAMPGISENFLAPVTDSSNRRCQEWTMEFVRCLVAEGLIGSDAIRAVQCRRDPAGHGVGLKAVQTCY